MGRKGFEPSTPAMSRHLDTDFWIQYKSYLSGSSNRDTTNDRIAYAKRYYNVLQSGNASDLLSLTVDKRIHAMKSLAAEMVMWRFA
jgi:hypothetical protein